MFKVIPGFEDRYEVNEAGQVRNLRTGRILKPTMHRAPDKAPTVALFLSESKKQVRLVKDVVWLAHVGSWNNRTHRIVPDSPKDIALAKLKIVARPKHTPKYTRRNTNCVRGHDLEPWNLVPSSLRIGQRRCLACHRAHAMAKLHSAHPVGSDGFKADWKAYSDLYFDEIRKERSNA